MRDGEGNFYFIWFSAAGAVIRGFSYESPMSPTAANEEPWPGLFAD